MSNESSIAHVHGASGAFVVPAHSPYDRQLLREHIELLAGIGTTLTIDGTCWQLTRGAVTDARCTACSRRVGRLSCSRKNETKATCIDCVTGKRSRRTQRNGERV